MRKNPLVLDRELYHDVKVHANAYKNPDVFGIEVELEGRGLTTTDPETVKYYTTHQDNSLRTLREDSEALEYVFEQPLDYPTTIRAVKLLFAYLNGDKSEVFDSYRTSFHVHVNCGKETFRTIYNYITLAIIFDELFVSQNGAHRVGNNFCLRAKDAQAQVLDLVHSIEEAGHIWHINANHRYSSVNFASLLKFGTIEFRSMECTTDFARVHHWIDTVQRLKVAARGFANPKEIIQAFSNKGPEQFMKDVLGACSDYYEQVDGWQRTLMGGVRLAQDLAYCCTWEADTGKPVQQKGYPKMKPMPGIFGNPQHLAAHQAAMDALMNAGMPAPQWVVVPPPVALDDWGDPIEPDPVVNDDDDDDDDDEDED